MMDHYHQEQRAHETSYQVRQHWPDHMVREPPSTPCGDPRSELEHRCKRASRHCCILAHLGIFKTPHVYPILQQLAVGQELEVMVYDSRTIQEPPNGPYHQESHRILQTMS